MQPINNLSEALAALRTYERDVVTNAADYDPRFLKSLERATNQISPVDVVVSGVETLWAFRSGLDIEGKQLCYTLVSYCYIHGFHGLCGSRGTAMCKSLLRDMGTEPPDGGQWPDPSEDPGAKEEYLAPLPSAPAPGAVNVTS